MPHALGQEVRYDEGEGPLLHELKARRRSGHCGREKDEPSGLRRFSRLWSAHARHCRRRVALIGFAGAPWTVATYMLEGQGSADQRIARLWAYERPEALDKLVDVLTEATISYLSGANRGRRRGHPALRYLGGALSAEGFARWCIAPAKRIAAALKARFPALPVIGFARGAGASLLRYAEETGVSAVSLDWTVPLDWARDSAAAEGRAPGKSRSLGAGRGRPGHARGGAAHHGKLGQWTDDLQSRPRHSARDAARARGRAREPRERMSLCEARHRALQFGRAGPAGSRQAVSVQSLQRPRDHRPAAASARLVAGLIAGAREQKSASHLRPVSAGARPSSRRPKPRPRALAPCAARGLRGRCRLAAFRRHALLASGHRPDRGARCEGIPARARGLAAALSAVLDHHHRLVRRGLDRGRRGAAAWTRRQPSSVLLSVRARLCRGSCGALARGAGEGGRGAKPVRVLFSAQGCRERVVMRGDPYQWQIEETAKAVVRALGGAQTRLARVLSEPRRSDGLAQALDRGRNPPCRAATAWGSIVVPVAFVSEHSETLVELDIEYAKLAAELRRLALHPRAGAAHPGALHRGLARARCSRPPGARRRLGGARRRAHLSRRLQDLPAARDAEALIGGIPCMPGSQAPTSGSRRSTSSR